MKIVLTFFLIFGFCIVHAQKERVIHLTSGRGNMSFETLLSLPDDYATSGKRYPLLVFLHGAGLSCPPISSIYNSALEGGPSYFIEHDHWPSYFNNPADGKNYKFIVITPQSNCNKWSSNGNQIDLMIREMIVAFRVDTNRIYLTGISAGGDGVFRYAARLPSDNGQPCNPMYKVAAIVPMSAASGDIGQAKATQITLSNIRAWGFGDPLGDVHGANTKAIMKEMNQAKYGSARFTAYSGGHCCWGNFYSPRYSEDINGRAMNIYEWMLQFTSADTNTNIVHPFPFVSVSGCSSDKKYYVTASYNGGVRIDAFTGGQNPFIYKGGDTIVFKAGKWGDIRIDGINGSSYGCPITIINEGGQVKFRSSHLKNSKYIHWTGSGTKGVFYGFMAEVDPYRNNLGEVGISFEGRSKVVTYDHIYIHNVNQGIYAHTENTCVDSLIYPNWLMDSLIIHDCKIVGTAHEGMYIGSTSPDNSATSYSPRPVDCNGITTYPRPIRTGYVHVYKCIVDSTGRGGIQVASASGGNVEIDNNIVKHSGMSGMSSQGTGISIGSYTHAYIHDNRVINTLTWGIASLGGSGTKQPIRIENNFVDSSGYLYTYDNVSNNNIITPESHLYPPGKIPGHEFELGFVSSVFLKTVPIQDTDSTMFSIRNNKLGISMGGPYKIKLENGAHTMRRNGNVICNNFNLDGSPTKISVNIGSYVNYSTVCHDQPDLLKKAGH